MLNNNKATLVKIKIPSIALLSFISFFCASEESHGLVLNLTTSISQDDNIFKNSSEIQDQTFTLEPIVLFDSSIGKHDIYVKYSGEYSLYNDRSNLNYNNHDFLSSVTLNHSHRLSTEFAINYQNQIEQPNSTNAISINENEFNQFDQKGFNAIITYGQEDSTGQIELAYSLNDTEYKNNQQSFRDLTTNTATATFFYKLSNVSRLLLQGQVSDIDYKNNTSAVIDQSSNQYSLLTGFVWQTTAKTTGEFKVGYQSKQYEAEQLNDIDGLTYSLDMTWTPKTYTTISLGSSKTTTESALENESGYDITSYYIDLSHNLLTRTDLKLGLQHDTSDIQENIFNNLSQERTDKHNKVNVGITHSLRKWLNINLTYSYEERTSINTLLNFKANIIQLSFETTFE